MKIAKKAYPVIAESSLLAVMLLLYVLFASLYIRYPGLHYDEMVFVNAALGGIDDSFIVERIGSIPVYLCAYMGALKAYLYYPLFSLFEVSAVSVRLPMILLTAGSFLVLFLAVKKAFCHKTAWVAFLLFISDPSIMAHTRTDNGPTAIQLFLSAVCLYLLFKCYATRKKVLLLALYCTCWVGLYYNIKFLWFINSIFFSVVLLNADTIYKKIRARETGALLKDFSCLIVAYVPFFIYMLIISRVYPLKTTSFQGMRKALNIINVIQGEAYYDFALGTLENSMANPYLLFVIMLLIAGTLAIFLSRNSDQSLKYKLSFFWAVLITTCMQLYITPQAKQFWHAFKIYPAITIILAVCIVATEARIRKIGSGYARGFLAVALVLLVGYNTLLVSEHIKAYRDKKSKIHWSEVVYDVIEYTREEKGRFFSCTWGIHNQLISFNKDPYRFQEIYQLLNCDMTEREQELFYSTYLKKDSTAHYFIIRPKNMNMVKKPRENLFKIAHKYGVKLKEHRRFHDTSDNQDIFIIYRIQ